LSVRYGKATFRLAGGKVVVEPRRAGGLEGLLAIAREVVQVLEAELGMMEQDAA
jgi:hypothetical protein